MEKSIYRILLPLVFYLLFFSIFPTTSHGQSVYDLSWKKEVPLLAGGFIGSAASLALRARHQPLSEAEIGRLNKSDVNAFDRSAIQYHGKGARKASDVLLTLSYAFPATTLFLPKNSKGIETIAVMLAETLLLNETLTGITKTWVQRPRPYTYNEEVSDLEKMDKNSNLSFFSGHTSYTAALSFFTAKVISDYSDNHTLEIIAWTGAALVPAVTGYMRYRAGMHFPTDIITGYIVGASLGYLIPELHKVKAQEKIEKMHLSQLFIGPGTIYVGFRF